MDHEEASGVPSGGERPIAAEMVGAVNRLADRTSARGQKANLVAHIAQLVGDSEMDPSIPGRAADAVLVHHLDADALEGLLEQIRCIRARDGPDGFRTSSGAYFLCGIRKLCRTAGIPWTAKTRREN